MGAQYKLNTAWSEIWFYKWTAQ